MQQMKPRCSRWLSFFIKVDAHLLNNRYAIERRKRITRISVAMVSSLLLLSATLTYGINQSYHAASQAQSRVKFEKEVFPYSLVYSYCENFLFKLKGISDGNTKAVCMTPSRNNANSEEIQKALQNAYLLAPAEKCVLILAMPQNYAELSNQEGNKKTRVAEDAGKFNWEMENKGFNFSELKARPITTILLNHKKSGIISTDPNYTKVRVFADMASTVNSIKAVVDYLKNGEYYAKETFDELALEYISTFKNCVVEEFAKSIFNHQKPKAINYLDKTLDNLYILGNLAIYFVEDEKKLGQALNDVVAKYGQK